MGPAGVVAMALQYSGCRETQEASGHGGRSHQPDSREGQAGRSEVDLDGLGPTIRSEHNGNIEFRRLSASNGGQHARELAAGLPQRRLIVRECARIQSFPDDLELVVPGGGGEEGVSGFDGYKLVGNAVQPLLGYRIAWRLDELWSVLSGAKG